MKKLLLLILTSLLIYSVNAQPFGATLWFDDMNDNIVANSVSTALVNETEMKSQSMFAGANWDFTSETGTWNIQSGEYISYPYLQSFTYDIPGTAPQVNPIPGLSFAPVTWIGTNSDNWDTPTNWSRAVVPTIERDVTIPGTELIYLPVIYSGTHAAARNLTNNSINGISVKTGGKLTIGVNYTAVESACIKLGQ